MPRSPQNCPYRFPSPESSAAALCRFILDSSGVEDEHLAGVSDEVCRACCQHFNPHPGTPNPVVAAMLYHLAAKAEQLGFILTPVEGEVL